MDERIKTVLTYIGIILGIFIVFRYILPLILNLLGFVLTVFFSVFMWIAIIVIAILLADYLFNIRKNNG